MTYKEITKRIENIDKCIELVKEAKLNENDLDKQKQWEYTIDYLCGYKNYIKYDKQFDERPLEFSNAEEKQIVFGKIPPLCKRRNEDKCNLYCDGFDTTCDDYTPFNK